MVESLFDLVLRSISELKFFYLRWRIGRRIRKNFSGKPIKQDLDVYSKPSFADSVNEWGDRTAWSEVQFLLANCAGKVLDIACGPCAVFPLLRQLNQCDLYGCDISDFLINKAVETGVPRSRLTVCDATKTPYPGNYFDYSYSIGSLEHFTEEGISNFLMETFRITKYSSFHQIPTSRSGRNHGWVRLDQSYFNNSVDWWLEKFQKVYDTVYVLDSAWEDSISKGKWFVCVKAVLSPAEHPLDGGLALSQK